MKKTLWIGLGATGLLLVAGAAYAMGHHGRGHMIEARIQDAEDYIDATPQQRQVIDQAKDKILAQFDAQAQSRKAAHQQIMALLAADKLDTVKLNQLVDAQVDSAREMAHGIVAQVASIHAALTPDQRAKLIARFKQHHGHAGGFGGPPQE